MVEFALVMPILIMLLFGVATAAFAYSRALGVTNAVREGSRFGATADGAHPDWSADVIARVRGTQFDDPAAAAQSSTDVCVDLYKQGSGSVAGPSCEPGGRSQVSPSLDASGAPPVPASVPTGACVVRVWAAQHFKIEVMVFPVKEGNLVRSVVARYEKPTC